MLSIAAWLNARGVMKSGSPTPREMQSFLVAAISKNFLMPEGFPPLIGFEKILTPIGKLFNYFFDFAAYYKYTLPTHGARRETDASS